MAKFLLPVLLVSMSVFVLMAVAQPLGIQSDQNEESLDYLNQPPVESVPTYTGDRQLQRNKRHLIFKTFAFPSHGYFVYGFPTYRVNYSFPRFTGFSRFSGSGDDNGYEFNFEGSYNRGSSSTTKKPKTTTTTESSIDEDDE